MRDQPWFDYLLGTRVISSADLQEQNPLGLSLPAPLAKTEPLGGTVFSS